MILDLHVHTSRGSGDSNLSPQQLVEEAQRIGLHGACLTEHSGPWDPSEVQRFASQYRSAVLLVPALEVESELGHITVFGLDSYVEGIRDPKELRRVADDAGAYVVLAHPFRNLFNTALNRVNLIYKDSAFYPSTVEEASEHPIFRLVDAIEVANGGNSDQEKRLRLEGGPPSGETNGGWQRRPLRQRHREMCNGVPGACLLPRRVTAGPASRSLLSRHGAPHRQTTTLRKR